MPSVLWHCLLGVRKSIRPVNNWVMRCWHSYLSGARCKWSAYGPDDATATPSSPASDWHNLPGTGLPGCTGKDAIKRMSRLSILYNSSMFWPVFSVSFTCYCLASSLVQDLFSVWNVTDSRQTFYISLDITQHLYNVRSLCIYLAFVPFSIFSCNFSY